MEIKEMLQFVKALEKCTSPANSLEILCDFRKAVSAVSYTQFITMLNSLAWDYSQEHLLCNECYVDLIHDSMKEPIEVQGKIEYREVAIMRCPECYKVF